MEDTFLINTFILEDKIETKNFKIEDIISSEHDQDCCELHYLDMEYIDNDNKMLASQLEYFDKFEIY